MLIPYISEGSPYLKLQTAQGRNKGGEEENRENIQVHGALNLSTTRISSFLIHTHKQLY